MKKSISNFIGQTRGAAIFCLLIFPVLILSFTNCMGSGFVALDGEDSASGLVLDPALANASNVMTINVGCSGTGYVNEPCVSVTICQPGTSNCQTIPNVLLDTGSYGLRLFSSVVNLSLTSSTDSSGKTYAECVRYADNSSQWGPVATADVVLGQETASSVPIQIINGSFGTVPSDCTDLTASPDSTGFNGILGVGLFVQDCGSGCATTADNKTYYTCSGTSCSESVIPLANQVSNPVHYLPTDNNGVIMQMESIPSVGALTAAGYLILGVGTQSNNQIAMSHVFGADDSGNFATTFNGSAYSQSFIDSGSNALYFPDTSAVTDCPSGGDYDSFYCPSSPVNLTATQASNTTSGSANVSFSVGDASSELASTNPNFAFNNLAGTFSSGFDWGLPFFYGRSIAVGLEGSSSSLASGTYWAF